MIDIDHFRLHVVRATLTYLRMWSAAAEALLVGTAVQESGLKYLRQFDAGPARGVYQIEPATHDDIVKRYLKRKAALANTVDALLAPEPKPIDQLATNLAYATAIARVKYWMDPEPLPEADDIARLAAYWRRVYNTPGGRGEASEFAANYRRYVLGHTNGRPPDEAPAPAAAPETYEFRVMIRPAQYIKKLLKLHGLSSENDAFTYLDQTPRIVVMPPFPVAGGAYDRWWLGLLKHEHRHVVEGHFHPIPSEGD